MSFFILVLIYDAFPCVYVELTGNPIVEIMLQFMLQSIVQFYLHSSKDDKT